MSIFFFQAEDGIRDHCVTGVQTCALPIWTTGSTWNSHPPRHEPDLSRGDQLYRRRERSGSCRGGWEFHVLPVVLIGSLSRNGLNREGNRDRSEERRVGKEWRGESTQET